MEIEILTPKKYKEWDEFCQLSGNAWFWQTSVWLDYHLNYRPEIQPRNKSFFVKENNKIIAVCPLVLETINGVNEFSYGDGYGPMPIFTNGLTKKNDEKIKKFIFEKLDEMANENEVKRIRLKFSVLDKSYLENDVFKYNYLMKFGFLDTSINTQVMDLSLPLKDIKNGLRHGHDSDINKAAKVMEGVIFDKDNITAEIFDSYSSLHHKAAGRITRPKATFDIMFDIIKTGQAFLVGAIKNNLYIGFSYFFYYKNNVYYGSSCNNPDYRDLPIAHLIQWQAIKYMQEKKYHFYEIGWQNFSNSLSDFPSQKEINIARFKRGFGGYTIPIFRGEKYYDKKYFLKVFQERINNFATSLTK